MEDNASKILEAIRSKKYKTVLELRKAVGMQHTWFYNTVNLLIESDVLERQLPLTIKKQSA